RERTIGNSNRFADLERDRRLRTLDTLLHLMQDLQRLPLRNRNWLRGPRILTKEARHTRRILHKADHLVVQMRLHQDIAREELALRINLLATTDLDDLLRGHDNLLDQVGNTLLASLVLNILSDLLFEVRISVN